MNIDNLDVIKKSFVTKELAEKLKEKGFDLPVIALYDFRGNFTLYDYELRESNLIAPLFSQVTDWLIDKHKIYIMVYPRDKWNYYVQGIDETISCSGKQFHGEKFESHYEALDKAIEVSLTLIK